ncbi:pyruvate, water dikinase regulatory protein [Luteococcus sp. Sow4_B9]|uniref:pyruvate, water dikinase regulatory protein n=1 Tax=Luteococcus sp. Sow4_B9 TaxID=3438792 RepID=UPI003F962A5C
MAMEPLQIHVIADSTGETAARLARAAQAQFTNISATIVRHPRVSTPEALFAIFDGLRGSQTDEPHIRRVVLFTLVNEHMRTLVTTACQELSLPCADILGGTLAAFEAATGAEADEVARRPVGVEADYFERISAMEFAVRNDDGAIPEALRDCDICLVGASRSGKTPLSIYLGYLGYKTVNVPLVPGIAPPEELFGLTRWRIVGLTIDPERLLAIRNRRVKGLGGFGTKDGYADLVQIYDELDEVGRIQRRLGCPVIDTTGLALEEAAVRVIDIVDDRARKAGSALRRPAGSLMVRP